MMKLEGPKIPRVIDVLPHPEDIDRCAVCQKACCNCKLCVKAKGNQRDMCMKCAAKAAGK